MARGTRSPPPKAKPYAYTPVAYDQVADDFLREEVFRRADWLLSDAYGMFTLPPKSLPGAGGGNWSIALVLLCVVDGISVYVHPTEKVVDDQEKRFKQLIKDRNPLVHQLAFHKERPRLPGFLEPGASKWDIVPKRNRNIKKVDARAAWRDDWPTLRVHKDDDGKRLMLNCAAFTGQSEHGRHLAKAAAQRRGNV